MIMMPFRSPVAHPVSGGVQVSLQDMLSCLSLALDGVNPTLVSHHRTVAYAAVRLAARMGVSETTTRNLFLAALLHDLGTVTAVNGQRTALMEFDSLHAVVGARFMDQLTPLAPIADLVRFHHLPRDAYGQLESAGISIPAEATILHFADWLARRGSVCPNILAEVPDIVAEAQHMSGTMFDRHVVDAFVSLAETEGFWLDLFSERLERILSRFDLPDAVIQGRALQQLSWLFSLIIDSHSRFTATHSSGVAASSMALSECAGWNTARAEDMAVAGYLHDIGKLLVANSILDKNGSLTKEEWSVVRAHTFHTQRILEVVSGFEEVTIWAADHHETLNGKGYPFRKTDAEIPQGSRVLAIADIFTALTEDRPYRPGLDREEVTRLLRQNVQKGGLDASLTECLLDNYAMIEGRRAAAQRERVTGLQSFWDDCRSEVATLNAANIGSFARSDENIPSSVSGV